MSTPGYGDNDYNTGYGGNNYTPSSGNNEYNSAYGGYSSQPPGDPGFAGAHGPGAYPAPERKNGLAVASLVLGIIAIVATVTIIGMVLGAPIALVGIIVGIIAVVQAKKFPPQGARRGMAITGLVLSILSLVAIAALMILTMTVLSETGVRECMSLQDEAAIEQCVEEALSSW